MVVRVARPLVEDQAVDPVAAVPVGGRVAEDRVAARVEDPVVVPAEDPPLVEDRVVVVRAEDLAQEPAVADPAHRAEVHLHHPRPAAVHRAGGPALR